MIPENQNELLRVMSYNILAQVYVDGEHGEYPGVAREHLEDMSRKQKVLQHIQYVNPDILCLQELDLFCKAD